MNKKLFFTLSLCFTLHLFSSCDDGAESFNGGTSETGGFTVFLNSELNLLDNKIFTFYGDYEESDFKVSTTTPEIIETNGFDIKAIKSGDANVTVSSSKGGKNSSNIPFYVFKYYRKADDEIYLNLKKDEAEYVFSIKKNENNEYNINVSITD